MCYYNQAAFERQPLKYFLKKLLTLVLEDDILIWSPKKAILKLIIEN